VSDLELELIARIDKALADAMSPAEIAEAEDGYEQMDGAPVHGADNSPEVR